MLRQPLGGRYSQKRLYLITGMCLVERHFCCGWHLSLFLVHSPVDDIAGEFGDAVQIQLAHDVPAMDFDR